MSANAADRVIIGNVSRTVEQLPNYAATDRGFFSQENIQGDVVLIGSTDTLIQALIAGQVNVAIVDPSAAINAVERGASLKIIGGTVPVAAYTLVTCPKYKSIKELEGHEHRRGELGFRQHDFFARDAQSRGAGAQPRLHDHSKRPHRPAARQPQDLQHLGDDVARRRPAALAGAGFSRSRAAVGLHSQFAVSQLDRRRQVGRGE